jgi:hypothetical protein
MVEYASISLDQLSLFQSRRRLGYSPSYYRLETLLDNCSRLEDHVAWATRQDLDRLLNISKQCFFFFLTWMSGSACAHLD